ncbi:hypothetical protein Glove_24g60 [Diversispora epigaea]|uniref:Uncharacterized protein n=1 Tax=Diversispora epigaea TaxID=1348612 RepID=A0A397JLR9_9GLOM|nr:hypothetical protein Glove_24g60 [Diversispora epigaea]
MSKMIKAFSEIYNSGFQPHFKTLQNFYNDIIAKYPKQIFESPNFITLPLAALQLWYQLFRGKIVPFQLIFDEKLGDDISKYSMIPDKPITSIILPPPEIASYDLNNIPYEFNLILRGSKDRFEPKVFGICVIKKQVAEGVKGAKAKKVDDAKIICGYNKILNLVDNIQTNENFIFSLKNSNKNSKLSRVKKHL